MKRGVVRSVKKLLPGSITPVRAEMHTASHTARKDRADVQIGTFSVSGVPESAGEVGGSRTG